MNKKFIESHKEQIQKAFTEKGYEVNSRDDYDTYKAWQKRGRTILAGQKGTPISSETAVATPIFHYGVPVLDENGKQKFKTYKRNYNLFHIDQTQLIKNNENI